MLNYLDPILKLSIDYIKSHICNSHIISREHHHENDLQVLFECYNIEIYKNKIEDNVDLQFIK